mgnify:FL=1
MRVCVSGGHIQGHLLDEPLPASDAYRTVQIWVDVVPILRKLTNDVLNWITER